MPMSLTPASRHSEFIRLLALMPRADARGYMISCKGTRFAHQQASFVASAGAALNG